MNKKAIGFYFAGLSAILSIATVVMVVLYAGQGGQVNPLVYVALGVAIVCDGSLLFGEKPWSDFTGIIAAVLLAYALMVVLSDGIWNIAESINGIQMVGLPELAGNNIQIAVVNGLAMLTAIISCFTKKSK
ncbi:MAG: hypothetical protein LUH09_08495 [Clostridiales bacterium]|nr:hypothetical protein [Clostridiales bacterium]MCD7880208.1 hypothetical protein [Clostridiales bacterium]